MVALYKLVAPFNEEMYNIQIEYRRESVTLKCLISILQMRSACNTAKYESLITLATIT